MDKIKGRSHFKYLMGDITLAEWCKRNGCSYAVAIKLAKEGKSQQCIKKALLKKYQKKEADIFQAAEAAQRKWAKADTIYEKQCVRCEFAADWSWHLKYEKLWDEITLGSFVYEGEQWKSIPGKSRYQASNLGRIRKKLKTGNYVLLKPYSKDRVNKKGVPNRKSLFVNIDHMQIPLARIIAETFLPHPEDKNVVIIKDKQWKHVWADNLEWVTKKQAGSKTGYSPKCSKEIEQLNQSGEVIKTFRSARYAAKELFISYQTVLDYANGRVQKPMYNLRFKDKRCDE